MLRRLIVTALFLAAFTARAEERGAMLLARAWPYDPVAKVSDMGRGIGIVFSPDLSVRGNCRFYESLGFTCFESTDWGRVLDGIRSHNVLYPERSIRTLILETHGTNGNGLKLQRSYDPKAERSYISVGALQEHLEADGVDYVILSACNSGRLMRPSIYKQIDRYNGDKLFLPATCGIYDASARWSPKRSRVTILSPGSSHIETTVAGSIRELSATARRLIIASAKARHLPPPVEFAVSDILCQIMLRDPRLDLAAGSSVDELSRDTRPDAASDQLFKRFVTLLNAHAALETTPTAKTAAKRTLARRAVR
jgi:hypothetical protein